MFKLALPPCFGIPGFFIMYVDTVKLSVFKTNVKFKIIESH